MSGGKPNIQALLNDQNTKQVEYKAGQEVRAPFKDSEGTFKVILTLDPPVIKDMSVLKHTSFHILLKLEEKRQPMELELNLTVTYESKSAKPWRSKKKEISERLVIHSSCFGCYYNASFLALM